VESLTLDVEEVVEFGLAAVGILDALSELALVVLDHFFLFLQLLGALLQQVLLLVEVPLAVEQLLSLIVKLLFDAGLFFQGERFGLDFRFLAACGCLNLCFFNDLLGLALGVSLAKLPHQFDDTHAHDGSDDRDKRHQPRVCLGEQQ
jgi:hypothetical protein